MRGLIGVDIGGSGIKAGVVDSRRGVLAGERVRVRTPQPATPEAVVAATAELVASLGPTEGPIGVGVPGPIVGGNVLMMANLDESWVGKPAAELFTAAIGRPVTVLNDADAAAVAEMRFGAGKGVRGTVLVLTLGTGIGSALFVDGVLVPNLELGHIEIRGKDAERRASAGARERRNLSFKEWAPLLDEYLAHVDRLIWPDLIILGGGISKRSDKFLPLLSARAPVLPAALRNEAGIVGAAVRARMLEAAARPPRVTRPTRAHRTPAGSAR
ncbi:MAG TPA: ROK family protein [Miltoncostaeaceae bacterium]|nr:ROK family protein [Miltoncostaeaceae bacterium]